MRCRDVSEALSAYLDETLGTDLAEAVEEHLGDCVGCRRDLAHLAALRASLKSLGRLREPDYLRHLMRQRLDRARRDTVASRLRETAECCWSRIRTTERIWYLTRILGTAATFVFFLTISSAMNPVYFRVPAHAAERGDLMQSLRQQLGVSVLKNLGLNPVEAQRKPISPSDPKINDLYLLSFGESISQMGADDSFSVVAEVDRSGTAKIHNVIEYPADQRLLQSFNSMITSARCRPASQNGRAVDSHLVLSFNRISVYD